jgi:hypothetical protein
MTAFPGLTLHAVAKSKETTVKNLEITKEPLTTSRTNAIQPGAKKIPALPMIPIPIPTIPMERLIPAKGSGKENRSCNSSTTTLQYTKTFQPGAGRSPDVSDKPPTASPKKAQPGAGSPSKISALPKPRRSMLPAPRKLQLPSLAKHAAVSDGSSPNGTPIGDHAVVTDAYRFRVALQKSRLLTVYPGGLRPGRNSRRLSSVLPSLHPDLLWNLHVSNLALSCWSLSNEC